MKKIRWGIIGCGDVCEVKSGPAFYKCNHSSLQAVMRRDPVKAADFARRHQVPRWYADADELIQDPTVDAIYVATPPSSHAEMAIRVLQAGKPVYVEKPMGMSYKECERMNLMAKETGQKLWVAYYRRSLPYFLKVKQIIDSGSLGKILTVQTSFFRPAIASDKTQNTHTWRLDKNIAGGGYFYDMASHTIDILMFLLGNITQAKGITGNVRNLYNIEDTVCAAFLFESGIIGSGSWCYASSGLEEQDETEIIGEKGTVRFSTFNFSDIEHITGSGIEKFSIGKPEHIQQPHIQSIVNELLGLEMCPSTGESGSRTNWVIDQIYQ